MGFFNILILLIVPNFTREHKRLITSVLEGLQGAISNWKSRGFLTNPQTPTSFWIGFTARSVLTLSCFRKITGLIRIYSLKC